MQKSTLNPAWPHFVCLAFLFLGGFFGVARFLISGWADPSHCRVLLNEGTWLDNRHKNWQPNGCMLHSYNEKDSSICLQSSELIFIGDSITRKLFFQVAHLLDPSLPQAPVEDNKKHVDHTFTTKHSTDLLFSWDPFLNGTYTHSVLTGNIPRNTSTHANNTPALVVLGSGLWYLRYANASGGIPAWESNMERIFANIASHPKVADEIVILPVEQIMTSKLSPERASTMHPSDIDAMNSDLYHRINPLLNQSTPHLYSHSAKPLVSLPLVFNKMLDESLTEDGLHFSNSLINSQAQVLLNLRCNNALPKLPPFSSTCCYEYPWPSTIHAIFLALVFLSGPYFLYKAYRSVGGNLLSALMGGALSPFIISASLAAIYLADRSPFWLKEQKQFDPWTFSGLCVLSLTFGIATMRRSDKDLGFLNRDQTDEWKGWMQIVILIYHYLGGSKISGIYNPIRVLVAAYLFMTGYGHTTFYLRKADYGFLRVAQVLIRLNLYTILLAYTMNTNYLVYYFTPLVSMWYFLVYFTMIIGARFNERMPFLLAKIFLSASFVTWFMHQGWLLETAFDVLHRLCGIHWSASEWSFRVNLDIWVVYLGMLAAIVVIKIREYRLTDDHRWPLALNFAIAFSVVIMVWFFSFELYQESKFTYNKWHPYVSFFPIFAFIVLRNATPILRSSNSRAFAFVGKCSLEAFIIQFHFWLAGDSKGVLLVIPGTQWRPLNFVVTSVMFLYVCDRVAFATGEITNRICASPPTAPPFLPLASTSTVGNGRHANDHGPRLPISLTPLRSEGKTIADEAPPPEPDTPIRPRWVDRLAHPSSVTAPSWSSFGLKGVVFGTLGVLWLFNVLWSYSDKVV